MSTYHIGKPKLKYAMTSYSTDYLVLFKLKSAYDEAVFEEWKREVYGLVGIVPGKRTLHSQQSCETGVMDSLQA